MLVLDSRPKESGFDNRLRGYNGVYCYYDELSKWEKVKLESNNFFFRLLLLFSMYC